MEKQATPAQHKQIRAKIKAQNADCLAIHKVYHKFARTFCPEGSTIWKYKGYDLIVRLEKYVRRNPEIRLISCDDSYFTGSRIVLIPHRSHRTYMGTTMVFVPQCSGENPTAMFLYPHARQDLMRVLKTCKGRK